MWSRRWSVGLVGGGIFVAFGLWLSAQQADVHKNEFEMHRDVSNGLLWDTANERIQPFVLSASAILPPHLHHPGITVSSAVRVPKDGWIVGVDSIGIEGAPESVLHHINFLNMSRNSPLCNGWEHFFAVGMEQTTALFPRGFAYPVFEGEELHARAMFHNHSTETRTATASVTFLYLPAEDVDESITPLLPLFFDSSSSITPCGLTDFLVPPGAFTYYSAEPYRMPHNTHVVLAGGHIHDHAEELVLLHNGQDHISFPVTLAENRSVESVGIFYPKQMVFGAGDELSVRGVYNNQTNAPIDGMAMVFLYLAQIDE